MPATNSIRTTILSNGLTVLTESMPHVRSITTAVYSRRGSRHDPEEQNGLAHFVEHMVFKGTTSRTARQLSLDMGDVGGAFNAFTSHAFVAFHATVLDKKVSKSLELLSDLVLHPAFPVEEIERERCVIEQEINECRDDPGSRALELYMLTQWPTSSLGLPVAGTAETIRGFTQDSFSNYAVDNFTGQNMVVAAAGNLQHDDFVKEVENYFGAAPTGVAYVRTPEAQPSVGATMLVMPTDQVHLVIGFPAPRQTDPRFYAVNMLASLLAQGRCSRFFHAIREQSGLVYSINADYSPSESDGDFVIYATTSRANAAEVRRLILRELDRLKNEVVAETEVNRFKEQFLYNYFIASETSSDRAHMLAGQFMALGHPLSQEERQAEIQRITAQQLREVANDLFDVSRMVAVEVGDVQLDGGPKPAFQVS